MRPGNEATIYEQDYKVSAVIYSITWFAGNHGNLVDQPLDCDVITLVAEIYIRVCIQDFEFGGKQDGSRMAAGW